MSKVWTHRDEKLDEIRTGRPPRFLRRRNMSTKSNKKNTHSVHKDVLFQRIGNTWFIFAESNGEMIYSVMPEGMDPKTTKLELYQIIEEHMERVAGNKQRGRVAEAV
jgi:hypothetical protein